MQMVGWTDGHSKRDVTDQNGEKGNDRRHLPRLITSVTNGFGEYLEPILVRGV